MCRRHGSVQELLALGGCCSGARRLLGAPSFTSGVGISGFFREAERLQLRHIFFSDRPRWLHDIRPSRPRCLFPAGAGVRLWLWLWPDRPSSAWSCDLLHYRLITFVPEAASAL